MISKEASLAQQITKKVPGTRHETWKPREDRQIATKKVVIEVPICQLRDSSLFVLKLELLRSRDSKDNYIVQIIELGRCHE